MWFHWSHDELENTYTAHQVTLILHRHDTYMNDMVAIVTTHPLAVGSNGKPTAFLYLHGKVNDKSEPENHESIYNLKFCSVLGFNLTFGYSRYREKGDITHAWCAFGEGCTSRWQWQLGTDLLLNLVGYKCMYGSHMRARAKYRLDGEGAPFGDCSPNSPRPEQHWQQAHSPLKEGVCKFHVADGVGTNVDKWYGETHVFDRLLRLIRRHFAWGTGNLIYRSVANKFDSFVHDFEAKEQQCLEAAARAETNSQPLAAARMRQQAAKQRAEAQAIIRAGWNKWRKPLAPKADGTRKAVY